MPAGSKALYAGSFILRLLYRHGQRRRRRELGLINNYTLLYPLLLSLSPTPYLFYRHTLSSSSYCPSRTSFSSSLSVFLSLSSSFSSAAVAAATLRLICADGPRHTERTGVARAKPSRVKIKSELICHERAPRLPFYPPRTLRWISARRGSAVSPTDSPLTVSTAVCLYQRHSKSVGPPALRLPCVRPLYR